jgi:hypothetical protein
MEELGRDIPKANKAPRPRTIPYPTPWSRVAVAIVAEFLVDLQTIGLLRVVAWAVIQEATRRH